MGSVISETIQQNYDLKEAGFVVFTIWLCPIPQYVMWQKQTSSFLWWICFWT